MGRSPTYCIQLLHLPHHNNISFKTFRPRRSSSVTVLLCLTEIVLKRFHECSKNDTHTHTHTYAHTASSSSGGSREDVVQLNFPPAPYVTGLSNRKVNHTISVSVYVSLPVCLSVCLCVGVWAAMSGKVKHTISVSVYVSLPVCLSVCVWVWVWAAMSGKVNHTISVSVYVSLSVGLSVCGCGQQCQGRSTIRTL